MKYPAGVTYSNVYDTGTDPLKYAYLTAATTTTKGYPNGAGAAGAALPPAPFDCPQCKNATHFLWGLATTVIDWRARARAARCLPAPARPAHRLPRPSCWPPLSCSTLARRPGPSSC